MHYAAAPASCLHNDCLCVLYFTPTFARARAHIHAYREWRIGTSVSVPFSLFRARSIPLLPLLWPFVPSRLSLSTNFFRFFFPPMPAGPVGFSAALTRRDPLRIIARPNRPRGSLPLYWPLQNALHLPVHVEFQNKLRRLAVVIVVVVAGPMYVLAVFDVLARATAARWLSPASISLRFYSRFSQPPRDECLFFLASRSSPALAFCSRIRTPIVWQFASLLILRHGDINAARRLSISEREKDKQVTRSVI